MPPPARTACNYRTCEPLHLEPLRFIRRCRHLGFTLGRVRELLELSSQQGKPCVEVDRIAMANLVETEQKIADLRLLAARLRDIVSRCEAPG